MDIILDLAGDLIEALMGSNKVPKVIRYIFTTVVYLAIILLFTVVAIGGDTAATRIVFGVLAVLFLIFYVHSIKKIHRS